DVINDTGIGAGDFDRAQISAPGGMAIAVGGWTGVERVSGFIGNDTIDASGNAAAFSLQGADGNDRLIGGNGNDTIFGGNGDDAIFGGNGNDLLLGGPGVDSIFGGAGNDTLIGNQSGDFLDGGDGSDVYMLEGADVINDTGTTGADRAQISAAGGLAIAVGGWTGVERINGFIGNDTIDATGATAAQTLDGSAGDDLLIGGTGNDTLFGGNGADRLIGGAGRDFLVGGAGADDFVFATGSGSDVIRDFVRGTDQIDLRNHAVMDSFADLTITQWTNYAVIRATGTTDEILLFDGNASALTAEDFIFA
ncbi:MAG: calcium-binding protein, partial [Paracoccaceae bacterium]|nr:calcium-binding protein [Paracoccaceae bacterium]